tara:strand:- start:2827 stop:3042 length:216 start_codon:yes stop_codon:yes gene_type:complete
MDINKAMQICFKEKIAVYPIIKSKEHKIEYSVNGVVEKRYSKILSTKKQVNEAVKKTYIYLANSIVKKNTS